MITKALYQNLGLDGTWSATSSVATLPAANLGDAVRTKVWRSGGLALQRLVCDLGSAKAVDAVAIVGSNITTAATVTVAGNSADSWGAPAFSQALTPWSADVTGVMVLFFASTQTYQYWAVEVTDAANPDGYVEVGVVPLGPVLSMAIAPAALEYGTVDPSVTVYSAAGTPRTWDLSVYAALRFPFVLLSESLTYGTFLTALREAGSKRDVVLSLYADGPSADAISKATNLYGRFTSLAPVRSRGPLSLWDWDAEFRESL